MKTFAERCLERLSYSNILTEEKLKKAIQAEWNELMKELPPKIEPKEILALPEKFTDLQIKTASENNTIILMLAVNELIEYLRQQRKVNLL